MKDLLTPATRSQVKALDNLQRAGVRIRFEALLLKAGGTISGDGSDRYGLVSLAFNAERAAQECIAAELRGDPLPEVQP